MHPVHARLPAVKHQLRQRAVRKLPGALDASKCTPQSASTTNFTLFSCKNADSLRPAPKYKKGPTAATPARRRRKSRSAEAEAEGAQKKQRWEHYRRHADFTLEPADDLNTTAKKHGENVITGASGSRPGRPPPSAAACSTSCTRGSAGEMALALAPEQPPPQDRARTFGGPLFPTYLKGTLFSFENSRLNFSLTNF